MTAILANGNINNNRRALDFYPTPIEVTIALMDFLDLKERIIIWECACGDGAMSKVIESYGHSVLSSDVNDTGYGEADTSFLTNNKTADAIITNPPFNLSEQFIKKAVRDFPLVALLLKSQYWHAKKRYSLFSENPPSYVLPLTWRPDFLAGERGGAPTMEVLWTVWQRGDNVTKYVPLPKP